MGSYFECSVDLFTGHALKTEKLIMIIPFSKSFEFNKCEYYRALLNGLKAIVYGNLNYNESIQSR